MHELLISLLQWMLTFLFTFEITEILFKQYIASFLAGAVMVGVTAPCLSVAMNHVRGVRVAQAIYYFYQDQLVFLSGPLEVVESVSLVVLSLSVGSVVIGKLIFISSKVLFESVDDLSRVAATALTVLLTAVITPVCSLALRSFIFSLITDSRFLSVQETFFDSVAAANRFGLKRSGFIVRTYCPRVRWSLLFSQFLAFRCVSFVMPKTGPSVSLPASQTPKIGSDRIRLFLHCAGKSLCWTGAATTTICLLPTVPLVSLVSLSIAFATSNAVAALWWLFSVDPFGKVYKRVVPTYRTLGRPAYKTLSVVE